MIPPPKKTSACAALVVLVATAAAADAHAYRLPSYRIAPEQRAATVEKNLSECMERLGAIQAVVPLSVAGTRRRSYHTRLTPAQRRAAAEYSETRTACDFWERAVDLKRSLLAMHPKAAPETKAEADEMAKRVVQRIYDLSQEYRVFVSAWMHNSMVNKGRRDRGHCYHYVSDIREALSDRSWSRFEMYWGEAWPETFRENNALVITARGRPFESGLAIDPWRTAGRPFWTPVEGDRFPWQDAGWVEIED